jgi:hypothetical protein
MNKVLMCMLSYNRQPFTKRALETFFEGTLEPINLIIIEQGSGEPAKKLCKFLDGKITENGSTIKIVWNDENIGIPLGLNQALDYRNQEQHFLKLDNDVIIPNDCKYWLSAMVDIVENHPDNDPIEILGLSPFDWNRPINERGNLRPISLKNGNSYEIEQANHCLLEMGLFLSKQVINRVGKFNSKGLKYGYEGVWYQGKANCSRAYFHTCHAIHGDNLSLLESHVHQDLKSHLLAGGQNSQYNIDKYSEDISELRIKFK